MQQDKKEVLENGIHFTEGIPKKHWDKIYYNPKTGFYEFTADIYEQFELGFHETEKLADKLNL